MKTVSIDPVTRLEGHGKISIFLNHEGNVESAYFQVPELGFEKFCEGRPVEELRAIVAAHLRLFLENFRKGGRDNPVHSSWGTMKGIRYLRRKRSLRGFTQRGHVQSSCAMRCSWSTR